MSKELVKKETTDIVEHDGLTTMQRRFCDYLIYHEGRTTQTEAAIKAGYAEKNARFEAHGLIKNPKIQNYIARKSAEVNKAFAVTKHNYLKRLIRLSNKAEQGDLKENCAPLESLIGKATGQFSETNYNVNINATDLKERENEIKILKELNERRISDKKLLKE